MINLGLSLISVIIISLISVVGIFGIISRLPSFSRFSLSLVGVAVGSLLGDAFIHLLPEANEVIANKLLGQLLIILGILLFFILEKVVRWRHCHDPCCLEDEDCHGRHSDHVVANSLVGEIFHNFIDGVIIASSFFVSPQLGIATSIAVLVHEIPQEIGDFAIYVHEGKTLLQALRLNLITALSSVVGVIFTFAIGQTLVDFSSYMIPVTAGGFIYLAASDLIPELHRHESSVSSALTQVFLVLLGVALMASLLLLE